jgi:hypothetical protein
MTYPQKTNQKVNIPLAAFPAASAVSIAAWMRYPTVVVNMRKTQSRRNMAAPRSSTVPVGMALR